MHEHGLGDSILQAIRHRFDEAPPGGKLVVRLRASEISGLSAGPLQEAMHHAHEQHEAPPIEVRLRCEGLLADCPGCGRVVEASEELRCAECGGEVAGLCAGDTVIVESVEVCGPGESAGEHEGGASGDCV